MQTENIKAGAVEPMVSCCPKCHSDMVEVKSSRELQYSIVRCTDCDFEISDDVPEETLVIRWNKMSKCEHEWSRWEVKEDPICKKCGTCTSDLQGS